MVSLQGHLDGNSGAIMTSRPKLGEKSFGHMGLSMLYRGKGNQLFV